MDGLLMIFLLLALAAAFWLLLGPALYGIKQRIAQWRVYHALRRTLPASHYRVVRDVVICPDPGQDPSAVAVGPLVVSPFGVFVIQASQPWGRISGMERDEHWTCVHFGFRRTFRNPLHQGRDSVRALQKLSGLDASCFHPLVVFGSAVEFVSPMPAQVTQLGGLAPFIQVRTRELLGFDRAERVAELLHSARTPPGVQTVAAHIAALRETHGSRLSAKQAMLGLGLMVVLLLLISGLVSHLTEMPGRFPAREAPAHVSPFVVDAAPPRINLPGVKRSTHDAKPAEIATSAQSERIPSSSVYKESATAEANEAERLAWESSLMCAYSSDARRCACYDPKGRKAEMDFGRCRALADRRPLGN